MLEKLLLASGREERMNFPVQWSEDQLNLLRRAKDRTLKANPLDAQLAGALLKYSEGDTQGGEDAVLSAVRENVSLVASDPSVFKSLIQATFVVQRLDLVAALLKERYSFQQELEIAVELNGHHPACVLWEVFPSGGYRFTFDAKVYDDDSTPHRIDQLQREFPLFAQYAYYPGRECGQVLISQFDRGVTPGLAYCDSRPDFFLIPDCIFVPTRGYEHARRITASLGAVVDLKISAQEIKKDITVQKQRPGV